MSTFLFFDCVQMVWGGSYKSRCCTQATAQLSHSPNGDVEDVAAHWAGYGHVPQTFPGHDHTGDQVGDGGSSRQDGQAHDLLWDAHSLTNLRADENSCHRYRWSEPPAGSVPHTENKFIFSPKCEKWINFSTIMSLSLRSEYWTIEKLLCLSILQNYSKFLERGTQKDMKTFPGSVHNKLLPKQQQHPP